MAYQTNFQTQYTTAKDARGIRLGEILIEQGLLSRDEVGEILAEQRRQGRPFGVLAERLFGLDPRDIEAAWVRQYVRLAGTVDPIVLDVEPACVNLINRRQAWQFHLGVVGREDGELVLITDEKHLARALRFAAGTFKEPIFVRVTESEKLNEYLMNHYPVPEFIANYAGSR